MSNGQARPAHTADFTLQAGDRTAEDLKVTGFTGTERISRLFDFRVEICSDDANIDLDSLVGQSCTLEIAGPSGSRYVHGIVWQFERTGEGRNITYYAAEVAPIHRLLTQRYGSRIFQEHNCSDMTVPGIIKQVLDDAGIPQDNYRFALQGTYDTREYVVQYRESEMAFISRLMEAEGIFYFFEHTAEGHKMVFGDSPVAHTDTPNEAEFAFRETTSMVTEEDREYVYKVRDRRAIRAGAVALDDYNFKQPQVDLAATTAATDFTSLEYSDYPGKYVDKGAGSRYASVRLEEFQCDRHVLQMNANVRALLPGFKFTLIEHPAESLNREYLVTGIKHRAAQPQSAQEEAGAEIGIEYRSEIEAIPSDVPFRPPRVTPKPVIAGTQTAMTVGPQGEEIYTDKYGRVKVQFHWDREGQYDENSSCWIRVSQGMAGGQYGMAFLPRVGQEVVVEFLEGDPDRPLITGRVYNNDNMPPYALPDEKTKSTIKTHSSKGGGGTNEIRFEDKKDAEQILIFAQKDLHVRVQNDRVTNVGNNDDLTVDSDQRIKIEGDRGLSIGGGDSVSVGGQYSLTVNGDAVETFKTNYKHEVTQTYAVKAMSIKLEADTGIELKCGGSSIVLTPAAIFVAGGPLVNINTAAGPPVGPVTALAASPASPGDADTATPGHDVTYGGGGAAPQPIPPPTPRAEEEEDEEVGSSWISFELKDPSGQPIPNERYLLRLPNGRTRSGRLDENGFARVDGIPPGECQICFPRIDANEWHRRGTGGA
jgi:type VI secretion system secreted protein VgrG